MPIWSLLVHLLSLKQVDTLLPLGRETAVKVSFSPQKVIAGYWDWIPLNSKNKKNAHDICHICHHAFICLVFKLLRTLFSAHAVTDVRCLPFLQVIKKALFLSSYTFYFINYFPSKTKSVSCLETNCFNSAKQSVSKVETKCF